jgi:hypothetical protein
VADGAAQRRGYQARRHQGRPRLTTARRGSCAGCSRSCARPAARAWCWCSTRSRPSSVSAATAARRASTRCAALIDDVHADRYPGLYVLITGTPAVLRRPAGREAAAPAGAAAPDRLLGRPAASTTRARRRSGCSRSRLIPGMVEVGSPGPRPVPDPATARVVGAGARRDDRTTSPAASPGSSGTSVGIAPRLFLRRLVDVLDRVDEFPDFEPAKDYDLALKASRDDARGVGRGRG